MAIILVIDDHPAMRELMHEMLADAGHHVIEADDGTTGLELLRSTPVDLVITDIIMPGKMEGIETIATLCEEFPDVPIIATSGGGKADRQGYLETALALGASATLAKPFGTAELLKPVEELLAARSTTR